MSIHAKAWSAFMIILRNAMVCTWPIASIPGIDRDSG
jgi:hypothetical protein